MSCPKGICSDSRRRVQRKSQQIEGREKTSYKDEIEFTNKTIVLLLNYYSHFLDEMMAIA